MFNSFGHFIFLDVPFHYVSLGQLRPTLVVPIRVPIRICSALVNKSGLEAYAQIFAQADSQISITLRRIQMVKGTHFTFVIRTAPNFVSG